CCSSEAPPFRERAVAVKDAIQRKVVVVADDEVVPHVERGRRFREAHIERVDLLPEVRGDVDRLTERIPCHDAGIRTGVAEIDFEGVVSRVASRLLTRDGAELGAEWPTRTIDDLTIQSPENAVLSEGTAGGAAGCDLGRLTETQTQRGVAGVGLPDDQDIPTSTPYIVRGHDGVWCQLPLNGDHVVLRVRRVIVSGKERISVYRDILRPVDVVV